LARICTLNNYPLRKMWERADTGSSPRQHVWGVDRLVAAGHGVDFAPFHEPADRDPLAIASLRSRGLFGHLDQEVYALRRLRHIEVLYCADQMGLSGLALARRLLPATRMVSVVHHPVGNALRGLALTSQDVLIGLSEAVCDELARSTARRRPTILHLPWGPDLGSPLYRPTGEENGVVSAGKSNRDLATLARAMSTAQARGVIYDLEQQLPADIGAGLHVVRSGDGPGVDPDATGGYMAQRAIADIAEAAVVAIPVSDPGRLTGLTEAADALALGKPIIATRSPYFPFDLEALGCGIWVAPGDVEGWRRALTDLLSDPDRRQAMGAAGRAYAQRRCNYGVFCEGLLAAIAGA
jgi:hypothetical protein